MADQDQQMDQTDGNTALDEETNAWDEFDKLEGGSTPSQAEGADTASSFDAPVTDADVASQEGEEPDSKADTKADASPSDDAKPKETGQPDAKASGTADGQGEAKPDIWASAPAELKAAYEAKEKELGNIRAREAGQNRKVQELTAELRQFRAGGNPAAANGAKGTQPAQGGKAISDPAWDKFRADYPEIAAPLDAKLAHTEQRIAALGEMQTEQANKELVAIYDTNEADLLKAHPDAFDLTSKPEFAAWLGDAPDEVRAIAEKNNNAIRDLRGALFLIQTYKSQVGGASAPEQPGNGQGNDAISGKRERQLEGAGAPKGIGHAPLVGGIPEDGDPTSIWNAFDEQERRQATNGRR